MSQPPALAGLAGAAGRVVGTALALCWLAAPLAAVAAEAPHAAPVATASTVAAAAEAAALVMTAARERAGGRVAAALDAARRAAAIYESLPDGDERDLGLAAALFERSFAAALHDAHTEALESAVRALALRERVRTTPPADVADALLRLSDAQAAVGRFADAQASAERALRMHEAIGGADTISVAGSLYSLALALDFQARYREALPHLERAIAIAERQHDPSPLLERLLAVLGTTQARSGAYEAARATLQRALALIERHQGRENGYYARALANLATVERELGHAGAAIAGYREAVAISERLPGAQTVNLGVALHNLARAHYDAGEYGAALPRYERALKLLEEGLGERHPYVAACTAGLALAHRALGQHDVALAIYERSLQRAEAAFPADHPHVAAALDGLASMLVVTGRAAAALPHAERALAMSRRLHGDAHVQTAQAVDRLGAVLAAQGRLDPALALREQALHLRESLLGADHPTVALSLAEIGALRVERGEHAAALPLLRRAERIAATAGAPDLLWRTRDRLRAAHAQLGHAELAILWGKQAVNTIQSLRGGLGGLPRDLQLGFLVDKRTAYTALADALVEAGRLAEAQQVLGMLKEEELADFVRRDAALDTAGQRAAYVGAAERAAEERWRALSQELAALGRERGELQRRSVLGLDAAQQARLAEVEAALAEGHRRYDAFVAGLLDEFAHSGATRQREIGARQLDNLVTLQDTLRELGSDTVLLHYVVAERRIAIIVTTGEVQLAREARIEKAALNRLVHELRLALQRRGDAVEPARALYRVLIAPVAADLERAGARKLALSLDGTLRYVPFAALHDGRAYLAERFALAVYTEAARTNLARRPRRDWAMTGLGLTREVPGFAALPAVREELEGLRAGVLPGEVYLDEQFTAERLAASLQQPAPVLHIASHFSFQPGTEADSFLVLGDGARLSLQQMRERRLRFGGIELLTLSACDTAMGGGRNDNGSEVEGFGALAQRQGAQAVLATLWPVADASSARFMQRLYELRQQGRGKADALAAAQREWLAGGRDAHPYFWAPYIVMGNWL